MAEVFVCFWFDVEDYVTPQSDDAVMRLARIFSALGETATFKVVGEKARRLRRRERHDVIHAVSEHDIGYHTDYHSVHPTPSEYLAELGWDEGIAQFDRREREGLVDVQDVFGKRCSTYGQPGGSWAPQVYPVLRQWGVPTYVDEGQHIGLKDQPFWYGGVLTVYRMRSRCTRMKLGGEENLRAGCEAFDGIAEELTDAGGGLISIYYHPCEWSTMKFWDGVNFAAGHNTHLDALRLPPLKAQGETDRDFADFEQYLSHIAGSGVHVVSCADLPGLYPDTWNAAPLDSGALAASADGMAHEVSYQRTPHGWASAAETLGALVKAGAHLHATGTLPNACEGVYVEGPASRPPAASGACSASRQAVLEACVAVNDAVSASGRLPSEVQVGGFFVTPAAYARAAARVIAAEAQGISTESIEIEDVRLACEDEVIEEGAFRWLFPEGFSAPVLMDHARLQSWTLKPAALRE